MTNFTLFKMPLDNSLSQQRKHASFFFFFKQVHAFLLRLHYHLVQSIVILLPSDNSGLENKQPAFLPFSLEKLRF